MKCCIMWHFISVFTVCRGIPLEVSSIQRVDKGTVSSKAFTLRLNDFFETYLKQEVHCGHRTLAWILSPWVSHWCPTPPQRNLDFTLQVVMKQFQYYKQGKIRRRLNKHISENNKIALESFLFIRRFMKVRKRAKIRNQYNQAPHLTQDTNGKVSTSQLYIKTRAKRSALSQQVTTRHQQTGMHESITKQDRNNTMDHKIILWSMITRMIHERSTWRA